MKIQNPSMPVIPEVPASYAPSSQNARIETSFHKSDMVQNYITAQRLQAQMSTAETTKQSSIDKARTVAYKAALVSGVVSLATIACAFFVKNGWAIPTGFAGMCLLCFLLAGKRTTEIDQVSAEMREIAKEPLPI